METNIKRNYLRVAIADGTGNGSVIRHNFLCKYFLSFELGFDKHLRRRRGEGFTKNLAMNYNEKLSRGFKELSSC